MYDHNQPDEQRCDNCGLTYPPDQVHVTSNGHDCCDDCLRTCHGCGDTMMADDVGHHTSWASTDYCQSCTMECGNCGVTFTTDDGYAHIYGYGEVCDDCAAFCERCDEYYIADNGCCSGDGTLNSYGSTYVHTFCGGDAPFHVGFELEIATDEMTATHVDDWGSRNIPASGFFDCKEDSSVEGFEIVTQPMTPEWFESIDWEAFFHMLNSEHPIHGEEPREHGLHVHVSREAFDNNDFMLAAFAYLIGQGDHLERIGRRSATGYCGKVKRPASAAIVSRKPYSTQGTKLRESGVWHGRDAINFGNCETVEIRAFKSTRSANELRDAVRLVYMTAQYVRSLKPHKATPVSPTALHWNEFAKWVRQNHPEAYTSIAGITNKKQGSNRKKSKTLVPA